MIWGHLEMRDRFEDELGKHEFHVNCDLQIQEENWGEGGNKAGKF